MNSKIFVALLVLMGSALVAQAQDIAKADTTTTTVKQKRKKDSKAMVVPSFPGGEIAMYKYISKNIRYEKSGHKQANIGKVYVSFVVGADGSIQEPVSVTKSVSPKYAPYYEREAIRIVKSMPAWTPGQFNGKPVQAKYSVPVTF